MTHLKRIKYVTRGMFNEQGVTLMEIMVYMVMAGMLLATAVTVFWGQNSSYNRQDVIAEIQQNIRGATEQIASDIRFAGVGLVDTGEGAFASADYNTISVNIGSDLNEDWGALNTLNKTVLYRLDPVSSELERGVKVFGADDDTITWERIAENIERLRFEYQLDADLGTWNWQESPGNLTLIRAVKVILQGKARPSTFNPTDPTSYNPPLQATDSISEPPPWNPTPGTGYRRMMSTIIQCRNNRG